MIEAYRKPDPDCLHCAGRGVVKTELWYNEGKRELYETYSERCICTDYIYPKEPNGSKKPA